MENKKTSKITKKNVAKKVVTKKSKVAKHISIDDISLTNEEIKLEKNKSIWFAWHKVFSKQKNNSLILLTILLFFVVLTIIFYKEIFNPYLNNYFAKDTTNTVSTNVENNPSSWSTSALSLATILTWQQNSWESIALSEESWFLSNFYSNINSQQFDKLADYVDSYMKNSSTFKTYYTANRLKTFVSNLTENMIYISDIKERTLDNIKVWTKEIDYKLQYKLIWNENKFIEERTATIVKIKWEYKIWKLMCNTTWCSKMPFFNFKRHGIQ